MRRTLPRIATYLVLAFAVTSLSFTGCQTGKSFKMPGSDWISSWAKKKPSKSSLASSTPDTKLPAPPSMAATPYHAPSYAQGSGASPGYPNNRWAGTQGNNTATTSQPGYGTQPSSGYYSNANRNTTPGYGVTQPSPTASPGYASGGTNASRGFYSPNYSTTSAGRPTTGLRSTQPSSYAGGYASNTHNSQAPNNYSSPTPNNHTYQTPNAYTANSTQPATSPSWTHSSQDSSQYAAPAQSQYDPRSQTQPTNNTPAYSYDSQNTTGGSGYYNRTPAPLSESRSSEFSNPASQSQYGQGYEPATHRSTGAVAPERIAEAYRPGSTSRNTQFGDSQNIDVNNAKGIQTAWFGDSGSSSARTSVNDAADGQTPAANGSPTRTATGSGQYPYTSPSTYR